MNAMTARSVEKLLQLDLHIYEYMTETINGDTKKSQKKQPSYITSRNYSYGKRTKRASHLEGNQDNIRLIYLIFNFNKFHFS